MSYLVTVIFARRIFDIYPMHDEMLTQETGAANKRFLKQSVESATNIETDISSQIGLLLYSLYLVPSLASKEASFVDGVRNDFIAL